MTQICVSFNADDVFNAPLEKMFKKTCIYRIRKQNTKIHQKIYEVISYHQYPFEMRKQVTHYENLPMQYTENF